MAIEPITAGIELIRTAIDKFVPDPAQRDAAKLAMMQAERAGDLDQIKVQMSAILAEASSADPWTSRARPSFLYVVYLLILFSIPMGVLHAFNPEAAADIAKGSQLWMQAIPAEIIDLFKWVMLGYIGGRSFEKAKGVAK